MRASPSKVLVTAGHEELAFMDAGWKFQAVILSCCYSMNSRKDRPADFRKSVEDGHG
jgi:hypothetical protein